MNPYSEPISILKAVSHTTHDASMQKATTLGARKSAVRPASLQGRDLETLYEADFPISNLTFAGCAIVGAECNGDGRLDANGLTCVSEWSYLCVGTGTTGA